MKWPLLLAVDQGLVPQHVDDVATWLSSGRYEYFRGALRRHRLRIASSVAPAHRVAPPPKPVTDRDYPADCGSRID